MIENNYMQPSYRDAFYEAAPIAACSSSAVGSAVSMIRMSGKGSIELFSKCLKKIPNFLPRHMNVVHFWDPKTQEIIDDGMAVVFKAPSSYTGEDSCELFVHAGPYIVKRVLEVLFANGFRLAHPGEFTQRAFLNGKIDLTKAEGIKELISCSTESQWMAARQLATGSLQHLIETLRSELIHAMAFLEAQIDFPDEKETGHLRLNDVINPILKVEEHIKNLIETYHSGHIAQNGLKVAFIGPPNAGKSSLMNALLKKQRAIVSHEPGTTRDYLEEACLIDGRKFILIDTAGLRLSDSSVENIGMQRSLELAKDSDCVVFLWPSDRSMQEQIAWKKESLLFSADTFDEKITVIDVLTKSDLPLDVQAFASAQKSAYMTISCFDESSLNLFKKRLCSLFDDQIYGLKEKTFITTERHYHCLLEAQKYLSSFLELATKGAYEEMLAFELQQSCMSLNAIIGDVHVDDLLDVVFSSFCIGK